ncbi:MAG: universal stress protein [Burkholderiaceae bacterium]|nr:universal stress protein [Burkholderiaceae bacterium]
MYQRILVPVDGSPTSGRGLQEAIRLALLTGGQLRLIHVVDELSFAMSLDVYGGYSGDWLGILREGGAKVLEEAAATCRAAAVKVDTQLRDDFAGPVWEQVTNEATAWGADLIVLGTHGRRGVGRAVLGSSAEQILRHASVPTLLVRAQGED